MATQMGNIGHSNDGMRQTCEWIWDGAIGPVREVHAWVGRQSLEQAPDGPPHRHAAGSRRSQLGPVARAARDAPVPSGLHARHVARFLGFRRRGTRRLRLP